MKNPPKASAKPAKKSRSQPAAVAPERYRLQLYITGTSPRSTQAVANLHAICREHLHGRYDLEVIDLYQEPKRAALGQIVASPTLVKILPKPLMRMVGNLANREQLMIKLHLFKKALSPSSRALPT